LMDPSAGGAADLSIGDRAVKVMTLNIWGYSHSWERRRQLIIDVIDAESPDIIGLQEVYSDPRFDEDGRNQAQQIVRSLPKYNLVCSLHRHPPPKDVNPEEYPFIQTGLAIMSRHPIIESGHISLPYSVHINPHPRMVLASRIRSPLGEICFFVTHLSTYEADRPSEALMLEDFIRGFSRSSPAVVVGDFNETPDEPVVLFMKGKGEIHGRRMGFRDAWEEVNPGEEGYTHRGRRIDYIFVGPSIKVLDCRLVADKPDSEGYYPSDHYGVLASIIF